MKKLTAVQEQMLAKLGLTKADIEPKKKEVNEEDRIAILEDAFAELCEVVFGGEDDD